MTTYYDLAIGWDQEADDVTRLQFRLELREARAQHMPRARAEEIFDKTALKGTTSVLSRRENLAKDRGEVPQWLGRSVITEYDDDTGHATGFHINPEWLQDSRGLPPVVTAIALSDFAVYKMNSVVIAAPSGSDPMDETWLSVAETVGDALDVPAGTTFTAIKHGEHCHLIACPLDAEWVQQQATHLQELLDLGVITQEEFRIKMDNLTHRHI